MKKIILSTLLVLAMILSLSNCDTDKSEKDSNIKKLSTTVNIECPETLKYTFKISNYTQIHYTSCKINNIRYSINDNLSEKSLCVTYDITKTYDKKGSLGDSPVYFRYILYASDGSIIKNDSIYHDEMIVNQTLKEKSFSIDIENVDSSYKLVFIDYEI